MSLAIPKPEPRAKAARKPLRRTAPLRRGGPIARRVRPRPMRTTPEAELRRACRTLASRITLERCGHRCECERASCRWRATDAAHGLSKGAHPAVEFDLDNLIGLSRHCHDRLRSARMDGRGEMSLLMLLRKGHRWAGVLARSLKPMPDLLEIHAGLVADARALGIATTRTRAGR